MLRQTNKDRGEAYDITVDIKEVQRITWTDFKKNFYSTKLENLKETDDVLGIYNLTKLGQDQISNLNRSISPT